MASFPASGSGRRARKREGTTMAVRAHGARRRRTRTASRQRRSGTQFAPALLLLATVLLAVACTDSPPRPLFGRASGAWEVEFPPAMPECPDPGDQPDPFPPDLANTSSVPAGTIPGSFSVSSTGEAVYALPLAVPPGRAGMQPTLAITYDSEAGEARSAWGFLYPGCRRSPAARATWRRTARSSRSAMTPTMRSVSTASASFPSTSPSTPIRRTRTKPASTARFQIRSAASSAPRWERWSGSRLMQGGLSRVSRPRVSREPDPDVGRRPVSPVSRPPLSQVRAAR